MGNVLSHSLWVTTVIMLGTQEHVLGHSLHSLSANILEIERQSYSQAEQFLPIAQASNAYDFSEDGRSGNRTDGGSRNGCPAVDIPLTALMPESNHGQTVSEYPTWWFYVPYIPEQIMVGEFVLQDEGRNDRSRLRFALPDTPGLMRLTLPTSEESLDVDVSYQWYLNLYCGEIDDSTPVFVRGWVTPVIFVAESAQGADSASSETYQTYALNRIWFDALNHLAEQRLKSPSDPTLISEWDALLNSSGVNLPQEIRGRMREEVRERVPDLAPFFSPDFFSVETIEFESEE